MTVEKQGLLKLAQVATDESELLDFKQEFAPEKKTAFWAEVVKDIVAFANTRGGILVFGVDDNGAASSVDCSALFSLDLAQVSDQVRKYTGVDLPGISIVEIERFGKKCPAILIEPVMLPLVFTKVGTYEIGDGKQKTAFSAGTVYFRHAAKSEPGTRDDLAQVIEWQLTIIREEWLGNIRKVVEAEPGSTVVVYDSKPISGSIRLTADPSAPAVRIENLSEGYPHRQSDVIREVNKKLSGKRTMNTHDVQAIKFYESITHVSRPEYMHKPHSKASPQYTDEFIDMIVQRFSVDEEYFSTCRTAWHKSKYSVQE